jgi:HK97 family phage portal protein
MSIFDRFRKAPEGRSLTPASFQQQWLSDEGFVNPLWAGKPVDDKTATGLIAFLAAVRILTDDVATLPAQPFIKRQGQPVPIYPRPGWLDNPIPRDPNMTRIVHMTQVMSSLLFDGNAFILAMPDVLSATELHVLSPRKVTIKRDDDGTPVYLIRTPKTGEERFSPFEIIHIPLVQIPGEDRGISFVESARQAIGAGMAMEEQAARFFGQGSVASGALEMPPAWEGNQAKVDELRAKFEARHSGASRSHGIAVLTGGAKFTPFSITPEQAQFIQTRVNNVTDMARLFRIPPVMLGVTEPGAMSRASTEDQSLNYVIHTIRPYLERIESAYSRLLYGRGYLKFNVAGLLRGDLKSRYESYSVGMAAGFLTTDDVRNLEEFPPLPDGDLQRVPLTHADREIADLKQRTEVYTALSGKGYVAAEAAKIAGLPPPIEEPPPPPVPVIAPAKPDAMPMKPDAMPMKPDAKPDAQGVAP